jgi:hypothetical protein
MRYRVLNPSLDPKGFGITASWDMFLKIRYQIAYIEGELIISGINGHL